MYRNVGKDPEVALAERKRQERLLAGFADPPPLPPGLTITQPRLTLAAAIDAFVAEKEGGPDRRAPKRWRGDLEKFAQVCGKRYLADITRTDIFAWMKHFQAKNSAPRTVFNWTQSLGTFLNAVKHHVDFKFTKKKRGGDIPNYTDPAVNWYSKDQLEKFFAACDQEERVCYLFFLKTGCREQEVSNACWSDLEFATTEDGDGSVYVVQPKSDELKFTPKSAETRDVPLDDDLVKALLEHRATCPPRRLVFTSSNGKPEGHFLAKLKAIAFRAGLNCGTCTSKKGLSCATHPVCRKWTLHRFRRTWATQHLHAGVSTYELRDWIGHSDEAQLRRYAKAVAAKSVETRRKIQNSWAGLKV
jgi:integrase/recombinase XerD